ncbi:tail protein [Escherichia phage WaterSpirit]
MAIYRKGQASMDAQGYITGYGTNWREQLTLIRSGATIIFLTQPLQAAVITEVVNDTSIRAITTGGAVVPRSDYIILLHDSLTVDGLAQDVAETLRYYMGKESELAGFIEIIKDFDWDKLQKIQEDVKTNADAAAASQKAAKTSENNAKTRATNAENSKKGADTAKAAAESARDAANTAKTGAETARKGAETARDDANTAKAGAEDARDKAEEYAKQAAEPYKDVLQPLPDVWIPFNDSLDMITGFSPSYKKIVIGDDEITMPGDKIVKFKRASTATYINKSGVFTVAEIDEPRFERDGLLIEGQRTNNFINSNSPNKWNRNVNRLDVSDDYTDEFGITSAKFTYKESQDTGPITAISTGTSRVVDVANGEYGTISIRARIGEEYSSPVRLRLLFSKLNPDGQENTFITDVMLDLVTLDVTGGDKLTYDVKQESGGWVLFQGTYRAPEDIKMYAHVEMIARAGQDITSGQFMTIATAQVENGSSASSLVITDGTPATRASDMVTMPCINNMFDKPLTCLVEVNKNWSVAPNAAPRIYDISGFKTKDSAFVFAFRNVPKSLGTPYVQFGSPISFPPGQAPKKIVAAYRIKKDGSFQAGYNGILSNPAKTTWENTGGATTIRIAGQTAVGDRHLFGHIRNLRIWHKALTDHQLGEIV